ncbi:sirohydrochlorin chelatase [Effusibacillus dendaii]|uniref:Sirohydrochlorin cobaltochelatase n=1 Tax=Effusibacillus dendaii TaxID=2743772 RepID=A0A7I8D7V5_9BACL|nr:sirohydrochlorin chelatase [Effusibacillus dendaii]BCJ86097.1 sirohydrochlorin cobaltochelatase [Effusibacillus dendaii]
MQEAVLLIGHGSRDPEGNSQFEQFVEKVRERNRQTRIELCFLELADPSIGETIDRLAAEGVTHITTVPVILLAAGHVKVEIPHILDQARLRHPHLTIQYGRHLGLHEEVLTILEERLQEAEVSLQTYSEGDLQEDAKGASYDRSNATILLVGRGSSDQDANGDLYKLARILWERTGVANVEVCFIGVTWPDFPTGIKRAVRTGTSHVIVLPYFLFTGILMKRMEEMLAELATEVSHVQFTLAQYFGYHPKLIDIIHDRVQEVATGEAQMNCDLCKYRLEAVHHHHDHGTHDPHRDHHEATHHVHPTGRR